MERKLQHIRIALTKNVQFRDKTTGFEKIHLPYHTLPEINFNDINLTTKFMGKKFSAPLMVTAITGGTKQAMKINKDIAGACEEMGIGFGVGSQRAMMEDPGLSETFNVRDVAPSIFVAGNIGAVQLKDYSVDELEKMLEDIGADALAIHTNALQEAIQPEGTTDFSGCIDSIKNISSKLSKPCVVKEVGAGISKEVASKLAKTGIKGIDVGGAGGTSWAAIEYLRYNGKVPMPFWDYGIPTAESLIQVKSVFSREIIASGGIRSGLDIVKAISLGADIAGTALPVLIAQNTGGKESVKEWIELRIKEIKTAMFVSGSKSVKDIKKLG